MLDKTKIDAFLAQAQKNAPPMPSPDEVQRINERHAGDIYPVTVCNLCSQVYHGWRLGCGDRECDGAYQFGHVKHVYQAKSGALLKPDAGGYIEHGKDFSFIDERPDQDR